MTHATEAHHGSRYLTIRSHPGCFVCSGDNPAGLHLGFEAQQDGSVRAEFACSRRYEGYSGFVHGGVIATLLDGAMAHCLYARGVEGVTARLNVEYRRPVRVQLPAIVCAWLSYDSPPLYRIEAMLVQEGQTRARAEGTFLRADLPASDATP